MISNLKNSPKADVFLMTSISIRDLGHLSSGYLLADDIGPQEDCMNDYLSLLFEANTASLSVLYELQVGSSERK